MVNQIAANAPDRDRAADEVYQHLVRFWTPAMIREAVDHLGRAPADFTPIARQALERFARL